MRMKTVKDQTASGWEADMDDAPRDSGGDEEREEGRGENYLRGRGGRAGMCASIIRIR